MPVRRKSIDKWPKPFFVNPLSFPTATLPCATGCAAAATRSWGARFDSEEREQTSMNGGVEACPWGLLSLAGALAVLVVAPSQCIEAVAAARARGDGGPRLFIFNLLVTCCQWLEVRNLWTES
jgi:hypothetical protein